MVFTQGEKEAINFLMVKLMKSDGRTDVSEAMALFEISKIIDININQADNSLLLSYEEARNTLQKMDTSKKDFVRSLFIEMAKSDGSIDSSEGEMISEILD